MSPSFTNDFSALANSIKEWALQLGFNDLGITDTELSQHEAFLNAWLADGNHGDMDYMQKHGLKRSRPELLIPGTTRVISVRMNYWPPDTADEWGIINTPQKAYISRYALGRDYHKVMRSRLQKLAEKINLHTDNHQYRAFVDSAPVLEKALAEKAGIGWIGKHTNVMNTNNGSWFFLGELYTNLPLPVSSDTKPKNHCGDCTACIDICPTQAIIAPYKLDARRCISYLTIEYKGSIPVEFRKAIGNRIYGCDDCQLICPWNRFAQRSELADFATRHQLDDCKLVDLFLWTETDFNKKFEGSPIRRIGHESWVRNIAVAMGNAPYSEEIEQALQQRLQDESAIIREHVEWALSEIRSS